MTIIIKEDESQEPGYANIEMSMNIGQAYLNITIQQVGGQSSYLGANGWQAQSHVFRGAVIRDNHASSTVRIGPEINNFVEENQRIKITMPDLKFEAIVFWPYVAPYTAPTRRAPLFAVTPAAQSAPKIMTPPETIKPQKKQTRPLISGKTICQKCKNETFVYDNNCRWCGADIKQ